MHISELPEYLNGRPLVISGCNKFDIAYIIPIDVKKLIELSNPLLYKNPFKLIILEPNCLDQNAVEFLDLE